MNASSRAVAAVALALSCGCALTSKSDSVILRYFTPERVVARPASPQTAKPSPPLELHLGRVAAASYLRERMAFRDSDYEIGYYDDFRWTDRPEAYVRRAMIRGLFEDGGLQQVMSGPSPTLDIDVSAFEELRVPTHTARIEITWTLYNDHAVLVQKTLLAEKPIVETKGNEGPSALATAMAGALADGVNQIVVSTTEALRALPPPAEDVKPGPAVSAIVVPLPPPSPKGRR